MNYIENVRTDLNKSFDKDTSIKGECETFISPSEKFRIETTNYGSKDYNWCLTKVEIYAQNNNETFIDFFVNEDCLRCAFITTNNIEYLICAEDIYGGQTVIDLTNAKMVGYSPKANGFIWTDFHLSPDGKTLATIGCFWAAPFVIKLYDFIMPLNLPLREIKEIKLLDNDEIITSWLDNQTLKMKGIKRDYTYYKDGNKRTIIETKMEREININN